jgi:hypothetical protein
MRVSSSVAVPSGCFPPNRMCHRLQELRGVDGQGEACDRPFHDLQRTPGRFFNQLRLM